MSVQTPEVGSRHTRYTPQQLEDAANSVLWWPSALALLVLGVVYGLVSDRLTIGPPGLVLVGIVVAVVVTYLLRRSGRLKAQRRLGLLMLTVTTVAVGASAIFLLVAPGVAELSPLELLRDALLLWVCNVLNFALWYWELDGGGPLKRELHPSPPSTDFAFPPQQQAAVTGQKDVDWSPMLMDYLFLAFTASSTFGPTDTLIMARRAKALMMLQSSLALIIFGGIVARAVGNLN